jgi:potassium channel subfamily K
MITDLEYHAHDHEHESFGDLTKKETPGKLSAAAATALKKDKEKVEHALAKAAYNFIDLVKVVGYYVIGCLVLKYLPKENMGLRESIYFLTVTLTTIGYGDVVPESDGAKIFMMFWIVVGLAAVFPVIIKAADHVVRRMERIAMHLVDNDPDDDYDPLWVKGVIAVVMIVIPLAVGNIYFFTRENKCGWSELDALWMTFVTMTTVGYGDLALCDKEQDQLFVTVFAILSVVLVAGAIGTLGNLYAENDRQNREAKMLASFDMDMIKALDQDGDGVDKNEYVLGMLSALGHLDGEIVARYEKQFNSYDVDGSGRLTEADLDAINEVIKRKQEDRNSPSRRRSSSADSPLAEEKTAELTTPPRPARRVAFGAADANVLSPRYAEC